MIYGGMANRFAALDGPDAIADRRAQIQDNLLLQPVQQSLPTQQQPQVDPSTLASNNMQLYAPSKPKPLLWGGQPLDKVFDPFFEETESPKAGQQPYNPFLLF